MCAATISKGMSLNSITYEPRTEKLSIAIAVDRDAIKTQEPEYDSLLKEAFVLLPNKYGEPLIRKNSAAMSSPPVNGIYTFDVYGSYTEQDIAYMKEQGVSFGLQLGNDTLTSADKFTDIREVR